MFVLIYNNHVFTVYSVNVYQISIIFHADNILIRFTI